MGRYWTKWRTSRGGHWEGNTHLNVGVWHRYVPMEVGTLGPYGISMCGPLATWLPCLGVSSLSVCQTLQAPSPAAHTMGIRKHIQERNPL